MNTNDLNSLESRMRRWTPRRPSPALEAKLFGQTSQPLVRSSPEHWRLPKWGWLAPAACAVLVVLQMGVPDAESRLAAGGATLASVSLSNLTVDAFAPHVANSAMNNVNGQTFESTNWTTAPSPMRTLPVFLTLTNGLIQ